MKLTPEQKAFYEYGEVVANLSFAKDFFRLNQRDLKKYEDIVLMKRAACRAWTIPSAERICKNCAHEGTHPYATPCSECFRCPFAQAYEGFSDNWEPRKEGE